MSSVPHVAAGIRVAFDLLGLFPAMRTPGATSFAALKAYVGFGERQSRDLRGFHASAAPHFPQILRISRPLFLPPEGGALHDGLDRLLTDWLDSLLAGPHDDGYPELRLRLGHDRLADGVDQGRLVAAVGQVRRALASVADAENEPLTARSLTTALDQILDLDLALMLEAYREELVERNRTAERLATVGQFAAGIGHELRNPLAVIESSAFLLAEQLRRAGLTSGPLGRHAEKIASEVRRATKIIDDLLALARNRPPRRRAILVDEVLDRALAAAALPTSILVHRQVPEALTLPVDPEQFVQILVNLLQNASDAMEGRGRLWLEAARSATGTLLRIRDDGPGIAPSTRSHLFEPLYTTKPHGNGLGLALCRRIADAHGASLSLEASLGGASFLLAVPDEARSTAQ